MKAFFRYSTILLICCIMMALLPLNAQAGTYNSLTYELKDGKVTITNCATGASGKVVVPDTIEGCPVTAIGDKAFYSKDKITEILLPDSVTTIGKSAFAKCSRLTTVNLPHGLTSINQGVFADCTSLASLHLPATITKIDSEAFNACTSLSSLTVASGNSVYHGAGNCIIRTADKAVVVASVHSAIPADGTVTTIATNAFKGQSGLTDFVVPHGITTIENGAFTGCSNLRSVHLSDTVKNLSPLFASNSLELSSLTVDGSNPVYHSSGNCIIQTKTKTLVRGCKGAVLPTDGTVTAIGDYAFAYVRGLGTITLPSGIKSIGRYAFANSDLSGIGLPDTLLSAADSAFNGTALSEITFPSSVTRIDSYCLTSCKNLQKVTILNPDTKIGQHEKTFYGNVTIYGYQGSTAEAYAKKYEKAFVALNPHTCQFDQALATDAYLSTPASCTAPATYFYSCTCGEKGVSTFAHGDALAHTYDNDCDASCNLCNATRIAPHSYADGWSSDTLSHWHQCACGAKTGEAAHAWDNGTATDAEHIRFLCTVCNAQRTESIVAPPEVTEPTTPSEPEATTPPAPSEPEATVPAPTAPSEPEATTPPPTEPTVPAQTEPVSTNPASPTPEQEDSSLLWILPTALAVLAIIILIIFLLKRKKQEKEA